MRTYRLVNVVTAAASLWAYGCGGCNEAKAPAPEPTATVASAPAPPAKEPAREPQAADEESGDETELIVWANAEPDSGPPPLAVAFTVESLEEGFVDPSFEWDFGDGTPMSKEASPTHTFEKVGKYTVRVSVVQADGQKGSDETWIEVEAPK